MSARSPWEIRWTRAALVGLRRLSPQDQRRIDAALERFAATGYGNIVRVVGTDDQLRLRVGDWRVRFRLTRERDEATEEMERRVVEVLVVRHRNAAYRDV